MAFDLFITFSGLCLFRHKKKDKLRVLLPETSGCHRHYPVFGYHARYRPGALSTPGKRFVEHPLGCGALLLDQFEADDDLDRSLGRTDVVDISAVARKPADPSRAFLQVVIGAGAVCPPSVCEQPRGARWKLGKHAGPEEGRHMATSLTWRIQHVRQQVGNYDGLTLNVPEHNGTVKTVTLRPDRGQIRVFVFHTMEDEQLSAGPPPFEQLCPNHPADHFSIYYGLFRRPVDTPIPHFVNDGDDEEEEDDDASTALAPAGDHFLRRAGRSRQGFGVGYGRRQTCVVTAASGDEEEV